MRLRKILEENQGRQAACRPLALATESLSEVRDGGLRPVACIGLPLADWCAPDLSDFDDICCEIILDKIHLNFRTHKMNPQFAIHPYSIEPATPNSFVNRFLPVLRERVVMGKSPSQAVDELIRMLEQERCVSVSLLPIQA